LRARRALAGCIVLGLGVAAIAFWPDGDAFTPDAQIQGTLADGTRLDGLVDLECTDQSSNTVIGTVRLVTQRLGDTTPGGREVQVPAAAGFEDCATAIDAVLEAGMSGVTTQVVYDVQELEPDGSEDGSPSTARDYQESLEVSNLQVFEIPG